MLLVIDVGNTNTVLGVFAPVAHRPGEDVTAEAARYERLVANWRVGSHLARTVDEYGVIFRNLFSMDNLQVSDVDGIVISSVVPPLDPVLRLVCERYFNIKPLFIEPGVKTGMQVLYDNPAEVGADRIVNAVAAFGIRGAVRDCRLWHGDDLRLYFQEGRVYGRRDLSRDWDFRTRCFNVPHGCRGWRFASRRG